MCPEIFQTSLGLKNHFSLNHESTDEAVTVDIECYVKTDKYSKSPGFGLNDLYVLNCLVCGAKFKYHGDLKKHQMANGHFRCPICPVILKTPSGIIYSKKILPSVVSLHLR